MLLWYKETNVAKTATTAKAIRLQPLWHNNAVSVQGRSLSSRPEIETTITQIEDLVGSNGCIMKYSELRRCHSDVQVNPLTFALLGGGC